MQTYMEKWRDQWIILSLRHLVSLATAERVSFTSYCRLLTACLLTMHIRWHHEADEVVRFRE